MYFLLRSIPPLSALITVAVAAPPQTSNKTGFTWRSTRGLLVFGDSYSYVQGTEGRQNYSFIADALSPIYTPEKLLTNTIIQNQIGTSAGGPNWVEYLAKCGLKTEKPSDCRAHDQRQLWDFAFAGADVSTQYLPLHHNFSVDLDAQVSSFVQQAYPYLPVQPKDTLAAVWIGINDVSDSAKNTTILSFPAFYAQIIDTMFESMKTLYDLDYRDFLFLNLPPLERTPGNLVNGAQNKTLAPSVAQVSAWNHELDRASKKFETEHRDANVLLFDAHSFLNKVWENPSQYGILNVTNYCPRYNAPDIATNYASYGCLPIEQYFWYNTGHITYRVHSILADSVRQFLETVGR